MIGCEEYGFQLQSGRIGLTRQRRHMRWYADQHFYLRAPHHLPRDYRIAPRAVSKRLPAIAHAAGRRCEPVCGRAGRLSQHGHHAHHRHQRLDTNPNRMSPLCSPAPSRSWRSRTATQRRAGIAAPKSLTDDLFSLAHSVNQESTRITERGRAFSAFTTIVNVDHLCAKNSHDNSLRGQSDEPFAVMPS